MIVIGGILAAIGGILSLVCAILVLIQLFKKEGVGLGILGIFCGIYTYIWGWLKSKELGLTKIMLGWTAGIVIMLIGQGLLTVGAINSPEMQNAIQEQQRLNAEQASPGTPP
jgi:hypothetical protein